MKQNPFALSNDAGYISRVRHNQRVRHMLDIDMARPNRDRPVHSWCRRSSFHPLALQQAVIIFIAPAIIAEGKTLNEMSLAPKAKPLEQAEGGNVFGIAICGDAMQT